jgi:hypothetical protein
MASISYHSQLSHALEFELCKGQRRGLRSTSPGRKLQWQKVPRCNWVMGLFARLVNGYWRLVWWACDWLSQTFDKMIVISLWPTISSWIHHWTRLKCFYFKELQIRLSCYLFAKYATNLAEYLKIPCVLFFLKDPNCYSQMIFDRDCGIYRHFHFTSWAGSRAVPVSAGTRSVHWHLSDVLNIRM